MSGKPAAIEEIWLDGSCADKLRADQLSESLYLFYRNQPSLWIMRAVDSVGVAPVPDWTVPEFPDPAGLRVGFIKRIATAQDVRTANIRVRGLIRTPRDPKGPVALDIPVDPTLLAAGDHNGSTFYQTQRFLNVVRGKGTPEVTLGDGAWAVAIGLVAQRSAATGQTVTISDPLWRRCEKKQIPPRNCVIFQQAFAKLI